MRAWLAPVPPLLLAAGVLVAAEGRSTLPASIASAPAPALELPALRQVAPWPAPDTLLAAVAPSCLRARIGSGTDARRAVGGKVAGSMRCGADGLPASIDVRFELASIRSSDAAPLREILGVHRWDQLEFAGARIAVSESVAIPGVARMRFAGVLSIASTSRRVELEALVSRSAAAGRIRVVGCEPARASMLGLPDRWGLGPWAGEERITVAWDLVFAAPKR